MSEEAASSNSEFEKVIAKMDEANKQLEPKRVLHVGLPSNHDLEQLARVECDEFRYAIIRKALGLEGSLTCQTAQLIHSIRRRARP